MKATLLCSLLLIIFKANGADSLRSERSLFSYKEHYKKLTLQEAVSQGLLSNQDEKMRVLLEDILDLDFREKIILLPLVLSVFLIGIFPNIFLEPMRQSIETIINNFEIANGR